MEEKRQLSRNADIEMLREDDFKIVVSLREREKIKRLVKVLQDSGVLRLEET